MALELEPPPHPPTHRLSSTCDRHPDENFTGFCASCLRERLQTLESTSTSTTHRNSTSTISSSLKSIFFKPSNGVGGGGGVFVDHSSSELRRCKSFSCGANPPRLSTSFEPQRRSCDVRGRNTLWSLFNQDDSSRKVDNGGDEITAVDPEIEVEQLVEIEEKPMKDLLDLESQIKKPPPKDLKEIAGSFWLKLQKWRRRKPNQNQKKTKKQQQVKEVGSKSSRRFRETQSEIAVDAFGRRSCDLDPRFSLDAGRISFDNMDPRYSFDEPRASWDGYLAGSTRSVFSRIPPMLAVVEDVPTPVVQRSDGQIPVEQEEDDLTVPGGSAQTKDYYSDSSSRSRRWSLDRSNSAKGPNFEVNELLKPPLSVSNAAKVSPAGSTEFFRDWNSTSLRDDRSERSFDSAFRKDPLKQHSEKKSKRWSKGWNIWGFINRRSSSRRGGPGDNVVVERSFSESWPNGRILRSNSNVSLRNSIYSNGGFGSMRRNGVETNGIGKKRRDEFVLERNRSARYSPGHIDNGMLRFYLTPMRGSRRGPGKSRPNNSSYHSFTRSVLGLY